MSGRHEGFAMTRMRRSLTARAAMRIRTVAVVLAVAFLAMALPATAQFAGSPSLVNVSGVGIPANAGSRAVAVSADGTLVAFASDADNLVPLDTNEDTDVFLHDVVTQITSRVSVNWQGEEAVGDSTCPSLSADGRYVAFLSRAWNMVQGGSNVGTPAWEAYLHDRQGPLTTRLSAPLGGGRATADTGCPVISSDGSRVAFASSAANLVLDDSNGVSDVFVYDVPGDSLVRASVAYDGEQADGLADSPALSGDGSLVVFASEATNLTATTPENFARRQVYARDLSAQTTELVSRAFAAPLLMPNAESCCPQVSDDGRVVLFHSSASNLTSNEYFRRPMRLFVHDRRTGGTEGIEPLSLGAGACGWMTDPLFCDVSRTKGAALSADGRFVAFLSGSHQLLPENPPGHWDQIFLQDRLTRRLRRLTVDPTGYPIRAYPCGGSSGTLALSGDGGVLAFVGENAGALGVLESVGETQRDVVRLEWTCDPEEGTCREPSVCPGSPASTCEPADRSRLRIRKNPPLGPRDDRFYWRWVGPGEGEGQSFVDPVEGRYHLCVYTGETMNAQVDAGIPQGAPWARIRKGWQRKDRGGAVEIVRFRSSPARTVVKVVSSSPALDLPYLPLEAPDGVTVQLHETTTGRCWESAFPASAVRVNRRGEIAPGGVSRGHFGAALN